MKRPKIGDYEKLNSREINWYKYALALEEYIRELEDKNFMLRMK